MEEPGWNFHVVFSSSNSSNSSSRSSSKSSSAKCVQNAVEAMLDPEPPPPSPLVTTTLRHMRADRAPQLKTKRNMLDPDTRAALGLARHQAGTCRPCFHAARMTADACPYQPTCKFCHLPHDCVRKARRASKSARQLYRKHASRLLDQAASDPAAFDAQTVALPNSIATKPWLVAKLKRRIQNATGCTGVKPGSSTGDASTPNVEQGLNLSACSSNTDEGGKTNQCTGLSGL